MVGIGGGTLLAQGKWLAVNGKDKWHQVWPSYPLSVRRGWVRMLFVCFDGSMPPADGKRHMSMCEKRLLCEVLLKVYS